MASGILGTASSALLSFQRALATTGHNISNVNTEGFSRQRVDLSTRVPNTTGAGFIGNGVEMDSVRRLYDDFLERELRSSIAAREGGKSYHEFASTVDNILADPSSGLAPSLQNFFDAAQQVADNPTSVPARQLMLSEAESLASSYNHIDNELTDLRGRIAVDLKNQVSEINNLASSIADINNDIALAFGSGSGQPPNDLLDQRDQLILQLSERVSVSTVEQDDHTMNVYIGNGQALVVGQKAGSLSVERNNLDAQRQEIGFSFGNSGTTLVTDKISGGRLGGILDFRDQILDPTQNQLGRIGVAMAETFNAQHRKGQDLDGNLGTTLPDFFSVADPGNQVFADLDSASTATMSVAYDTGNIDQLTADEYSLTYDGSDWTLENLTDGSTTTGAGPFSLNGVTITPGGAPVAGDKFLLRPTREGAEAIGVNITDARQIAAAAPVRVSSATNASGVPTNSGSGRFASLEVADTSSLPLGSDITFTFDGANTFNYSGAVNGSISYDPSTDAGNSYTVAGLTFTVTGNPAANDEFVISNNTNGVGDNRNALALAGLQIDKTMSNGTANFQDTYGQLIADVGVKTRRAETLSTTQSNLADQAQLRHDSVSAVNLDEEAAELLRWQQAYQAAARVVTISDSIFQTLLRSTGR